MLIRVWDLALRLFHWALVAGFSIGWYTREQRYEQHLFAGYTVLALVLFRIAWGFVGGRHARFADFVVGPRRLAGYAADLLRGRAPRYLGHNPAGGAMVLLMLAALLTLCVSGIALDGAENWSGPLAEARLYPYLPGIVWLHTASTDLLLVLVALHLLGVGASSVLHRENLPLAMITGRKRASDPGGH